jgi:hypothetical protein
MQATQERKDSHPFLSHQLDKRFSFNSSTEDVELIRKDPVHRAVERELWYQVSLA